MKERPAIGSFKGVNEMPVLAAVAVPHPPLIIPEVGRGEEKRIQHTINAYQQAMRFLARFKPDTVVLTTPHTVMYADYFHISPGKSACGDLSRFNAPQAKVEIPYDEDFVHQLESYCQEHHMHAGTLGERDPSLDHATVVPLLFLEDYLNDFELVRVGLSGLSIADHYRLGEAISAVADKTGKRVVMIASGDLSHKLTAEGPYGFSPEGPKFDKELMECFEDADFLRMMTLSLKSVNLPLNAVIVPLSLWPAPLTEERLTLMFFLTKGRSASDTALPRLKAKALIRPVIS